MTSKDLIVFKAKNMAGEIRELSYRNFDEIPLILRQTFGHTPLYEPVWLDEEGSEKFPIHNGETVFVLYRYINIPVVFINDWACVEEDTQNMYTEYTLLIESQEMQYVYEEVVLSFFYNKNNNRFYSEKSNFNIIEEDYGSNIKIIRFPDDTPYFTSIKDLFLSFKDDFMNIPEDFFDHLAECTEDKWERVYMR